jgi:hypothetical protein
MLPMLILDLFKITFHNFSTQHFMTFLSSIQQLPFDFPFSPPVFTYDQKEGWSVAGIWALEIALDVSPCIFSFCANLECPHTDIPSFCKDKKVKHVIVREGAENHLELVLKQLKGIKTKKLTVNANMDMKLFDCVTII